MIRSRRSGYDRRSGTDRRRLYRLKRLLKGGTDRRCGTERRFKYELRQGWIRVDKWSSVELEKLKIAKFLKQSEGMDNVMRKGHE